MAKAKKKITLESLDGSIKSLTKSTQRSIDSLAKIVGNLAKTVDNLAKKTERSIDHLTKTVNNLTNTVGDLSNTVDSLAMATQKGFEEAEEKNANRFKIVVERLDNTDDDVKDIKLSLHSVTQITLDNDREIDLIKVRSK